MKMRRRENIHPGKSLFEDTIQRIGISEVKISVRSMGKIRIWILD